MSRNGTKQPIDFRQEALNALKDIDSHEADRRQNQAQVQHKKDKRERRKVYIQCAILIFSVAVILYQSPQLIHATTGTPKPLRSGTHNTDAATDRCIGNLWSVFSQAQLEQVSVTTLTCPLSNTPYQIERKGKSITVKCPNPKKHHLTQIVISTENPIPELIP